MNKLIEKNYEKKYLDRIKMTAPSISGILPQHFSVNPAFHSGNLYASTQLIPGGNALVGANTTVYPSNLQAPLIVQPTGAVTYVLPPGNELFGAYQGKINNGDVLYCPVLNTSTYTATFSPSPTAATGYSVPVAPQGTGVGGYTVFGLALRWTVTGPSLNPVSYGDLGSYTPYYPSVAYYTVL